MKHNKFLLIKQSILMIEKLLLRYALNPNNTMRKSLFTAFTFLLAIASSCSKPQIVDEDIIITPLETEEVAVAPTPLKQKIIVIGPGHGGDDFGTQARLKPD